MSYGYDVNKVRAKRSAMREKEKILAINCQLDSNILSFSKESSVKMKPKSHKIAMIV